MVGSPGRLIAPTCKSVNTYLTTEYLGEAAALPEGADKEGPNR